MKAVLLDRDGVINSLVYHENAGIIDSPFTLSQFKLLPRVPQALKLLNSLGLKIAVVTNQPGIAKGHLKIGTLKAFEKVMLRRVRAAGGRIDGIFYCLHHPDAKVPRYRKKCDCRKPGLGLLRLAAESLEVHLSECYMVGDGIPDLMAGKRAGCRSVFIGRWKCEICQFTEDPHVRPSLVARSLWDAAQLIRAEMTDSPADKERGTGCMGK